MNKFNTLTASILVATLSLTGCGGDDKDNNSTNNPEQTAPSKQVSLQGKITDSSGNLLADAIVKVGNKTLTTDNRGMYSIQLNPDDNRIVVLVKKAGYLTTAREINASKKGQYKLNVQLSTDQVTTAFDTSAGITDLSVSGAKVSIPPESMVNADGKPYTGTVNIAANYYNPDSLEGAQAFAQPFTGQDSDGNNATGLVTVGVIDVKMTDANGNPLDLKEGSTATLRFPKASTDQDLSTIPLWYYDEDKLIWVKDGVATRQADGSYKGEVSHFTLWNLDIPVGQYPALVEGCFIDQETKKRKTGGVLATIKGRGFINSGGIDTKGNFSVQVPMNTPLTLVPSFDKTSFNPIEIPALAQNTVYKINGGQCIEATEISYDEIFTLANEFSQSLPEAPVFITPNPQPEPITPEAPFHPPSEQNKEGIIGYDFEIDADLDSELENVYLHTFRSLTNSVVHSFESLYQNVNLGSIDFEAESEGYMLTRQGLSQQSSASILDNKIRFEMLNTTVRGNQLINTLDNGFRGVLTFNDKSLSGLKIGDVLSYNISSEEFPDTIVSKINDLPFSKGTFSGSASCKVIRSIHANVDHIEFSSPGYNANFDEEARLLDMNPTKGTWAGIPWVSTNEPDEYGTYDTIVKSEDLIYRGEYTKGGFEKLSVEDQNTCEYFNEEAKNQILEALRTAYPKL